MARTSTTGPQFVRYFGPVLAALDELGGTGRPSEVYARIAEDLRISEAEQAAPTSNGQSRFHNQVAWARFYLVKAGLVGNTARGVWTLTEAGRQQLGLAGEDALRLFFRIHSGFTETPSEETERAPVELEDRAPVMVDQDYHSAFIEKLKSISPAAFERFCQGLLREVGFESVEVTGKSGDGGIDGIGLLQVNPLLSLRTLFQCKRYGDSVSSPTIRNFRGAMAGRSDYGIILTTGTFTSDARKEATRDGVPAIELVDGERIVDLCEKFGLGLRKRTIFEIDESFFD